jgi:hypothetical protein
MGISPITNLIPLSVARPIPTALEPLPMERVENSARIGDETYSPSGGKSARGSEDDAPEESGCEDDLGELKDEPSVNQTEQSTEITPTRGISFFA